jgi:hypothetical protein
MDAPEIPSFRTMRDGELQIRESMDLEGKAVNNKYPYSNKNK